MGRAIRRLRAAGSRGRGVGIAGIVLSTHLMRIIFGLALLVTVNLYAAVIMPAVIGAYVADPHFGSMFRLGEIAESIRRLGANFVAVWIVHLAVLGLTFVTIWFIVMIIFTTAYAAAAFGHVYGQAARIGTR